jgi:hypothetical protein
MNRHRVAIRTQGAILSRITSQYSLVVIRRAMRKHDRLCGLVVRVLGYRSGGPVSIPGTTRVSGGGGETVVGLERGSLSLREYN